MQKHSGAVGFDVLVQPDADAGFRHARPYLRRPGIAAVPLRLSCDFDHLGENCLDLFEQIIGFAHDLHFFSVDRSPMFANEA
jgi:hypothetical protein